MITIMAVISLKLTIKNQGYELNFGRPTDEYTMNYLGFKINNTEYRGHEDGLDRSKIQNGLIITLGKLEVL